MCAQIHLLPITFGFIIITKIKMNFFFFQNLMRHERAYFKGHIKCTVFFLSSQKHSQKIDQLQLEKKLINYYSNKYDEKLRMLFIQCRGCRVEKNVVFFDDSDGHANRSVQTLSAH